MKKWGKILSERPFDGLRKEPHAQVRLVWASRTRVARKSWPLARRSCSSGCLRWPQDVANSWPKMPRPAALVARSLTLGRRRAERACRGERLLGGRARSRGRLDGARDCGGGGAAAARTRGAAAARRRAQAAAAPPAVAARACRRRSGAAAARRSGRRRGAGRRPAFAYAPLTAAAAVEDAAE